MKRIFENDLLSECFGERHLFVLMSFLAIAVNYAMRFTLPIGIVAMVKKGTENLKKAFPSLPDPVSVHDLEKSF